MSTKKSLTSGKPKNRLQEWMTTNNYSRLDMCSALNCHYNQLRDWLTLTCSPTLYWAIIIQRVTKKEVDCESWMDLILRCDPRKQRKENKKKAQASRNNDKDLHS